MYKRRKKLRDRNISTGLPTTKEGWKREYKTVEWKLCRLRILDRDGHVCKKCGKKRPPMQVHHLYYDPALHVWEYPDSALVTLCKKCHEAEHKNRDISSFYLR